MKNRHFHYSNTKGEIAMKKQLNQLQMDFLKKHIIECEEGGILTDAFTMDGDEGMILYRLVSSTKTVKGAVLI